MLEKLKSILQDAPPVRAFEISEAGIAADRRSSEDLLNFSASLRLCVKGEASRC